MPKADAVIVLGRGIYKDGSLPDSVKAATRKALELYKAGRANHVIFSGKWSYSFDYIPPTTEARAMANYAKEIGLPVKATILEEESFDTISNFYFIKTKILMAKNWQRLILINFGANDLRAKYLMDRILGPDYQTEVVAADFAFPPEKAAALKISEAEKLTKLKEFEGRVEPGDHEAIFKLLEQEFNPAVWQRINA